MCIVFLGFLVMITYMLRSFTLGSKIKTFNLFIFLEHLRHVHCVPGILGHDNIHAQKFHPGFKDRRICSCSTPLHKFLPGEPSILVTVAKYSLAKFSSWLFFLSPNYLGPLFVGPFFHGQNFLWPILPWSKLPWPIFPWSLYLALFSLALFNLAYISYNFHHPRKSLVIFSLAKTEG